MTIRCWLPSLTKLLFRVPTNVERLRRLDDRLLDDIGVRRDQLDLLALDAPARDAQEDPKSLGFGVSARWINGFARRPRQPTLQGCG